MRTWALYPWFAEHGPDHVHPADLEPFRRLMPYGKVFAVEEAQEGLVVLRYRAETFRVRPTLLRAIAAPPFVFGQRVRERGRDAIGVITDINWHSNQERPFFHMTVDGRRNRKRLWEEDLIPSDH